MLEELDREAVEGHPFARPGPRNLLFKPVRINLLKQALDPEQMRKAVGLVAPTGSGKTVFMSLLFELKIENGEVAHWIWLDRRDMSLESLVDAILRTVDDQEANDGGAASRPDEAAQRNFGLGTAYLVGRLGQIRRPVTIFIDNLDSCTDPKLGAFLDSLIFNTPPHVRFVWSTKVDFPISKARAKIENLLEEIRFSDLNFSNDEIAELLGDRIAAEIGPGGIAEIRRRTEGWAAGVRMAQMILSASEHPSDALEAFSGADQDVSELLNDHVLRTFSPDLQRLLYGLSQLRVFSAEQLVFVTGDPLAEERLHTLITRNAFVMPVDRSHRVFRLHELFRDCLRRTASTALSEAERRNLFRRASVWCEKNGEWEDAIAYCIEAGDLTNASRLLDLAAPTLVRDLGKVHFYVQSVDRLLSANVPIGLETQYWHIYALIFHRRYATASKQHEQLVSIISQQDAYDGADRQEFEQRLDQLRVCIAFLTDRLAEAKDGADRWLASPGPKATFDIGWIRVIQSICLLTQYKFFEARDAMRLAEPFVQEVGSPYVTAWCSLVRGTTELYEGNCAEAYRIIISSRARAGRVLGEDSNICDTMASIAAKCAVEMNLIDEARELLGHMLPSARWHGTVGSTACGMDAAIALWTGRPDDIVDLDTLRDIAAGYPPRLEIMMSCHVIRRLAALGRVREATTEASRLRIDLATGRMPGHEDQPPRVRELLAATAIDLLVATKSDARAETLIETELRLAREEGRVGRQIELELACLELDWRNNRLDCARRRLVKALRQAAPRRVVRPFAERIAAVAAVMAAKPILPAVLATREERNFLQTIVDLVPPESAADQAPSAEEVFEMPTQRELQLLAMMEMGLSNQQLAEQTDTSITTIKWHLRNLFRKFNVANRTSAIARAHAMGLLSR